MLVAPATVQVNAPAIAQEAPPAVHFTVSRFAVEGDNPLAVADTDKILAPFLGEHDGLGQLLKAAAALTQELHKQGFAFHRVVLPPQTLDSGTVRLQLVVAKIGEVKVTGNRHFSADNVRAAVPDLQSGAVPDMRRLSRTLAVANQQPARRITLGLQEGKDPDKVDATLEVADRRPWTAFATFNNIGTPDTGRTRLSLGVQHSNLFDRDHTLTLSYTTSPENLDNVMQFGASYRIPLYRLGGSALIYYTHSDVSSGQIEQLGNSFNVSGAGRFWGAAYTQTLFNRGAYRHGVTVSAEDRFFENNVTFSGTPLVGDVRSRPLTLRYDGGYRWERATLNFYGAYVHNLPGGSRNNDAAYAASRSIGTAPGSRGAPDSDWDAIRYGVSFNYALPRNWELRTGLEGQWTNQPLIAGERFGVGGATSVRGFEERAVSGDRGQRLSVEVWTPPLLQGIRLLGFMDAGHTAVDEALAGETHSETIISAGFGGRWQWRDNLGLSIDYGHELREAHASGAGGVRWHVSLSYRY